MNPLSKASRLIHISFVLSKYGLDDIILATHLFRPLRFLGFFSLSRFNGANQKPRGERIRLAIEELGPIFVKFGQVLSTRIDFLPQDIIQELSYLQDKVPPFPYHEAKKNIESALNEPLEKIFKTFDKTPIASASIAQVHGATLFDDQEVIVKVLRPKIHKAIKRDIEVLKSIANLANTYWKRARRFKPKEIVSEFEKIIFDELDLIREAANASQLRRNFSNSSLLYIPKIYWPFTRHSILVMERIRGIPIYNIALLKEHQINLKKVAERGLEIFFTQVFRDSFFHADLHPGNLFIDPTTPENPKFIAVDFGIMGTLSEEDQRYVALNLLAFFKRDYRKVAKLHKESRWIPENIRLEDFEANIRTISEPIFEKPLNEISFASLLLQLIQTASRFQINIQPQLFLLQKTLVSVEGLSRSLDPNLNLWKTATPHLENWLKNKMGFMPFLKRAKEEGPDWLEKLPELPNLVFNTLENLSKFSSDSESLKDFLTESLKEKTFTKKFRRKLIKTLVLGIFIGIMLTLAIIYHEVILRWLTAYFAK